MYDLKTLRALNAAAHALADGVPQLQVFDGRYRPVLVRAGTRALRERERCDPGDPIFAGTLEEWERARSARRHARTADLHEEVDAQGPSGPAAAAIAALYM